jgi:hypothetical protein
MKDTHKSYSQDLQQYKIRINLQEKRKMSHTGGLRRNEKQEEQVNENQVPEIVLTRFAATQNHDESRGKEKDVIFQEEDEKENDEEEDYSASEKIFF